VAAAGAAAIVYGSVLWTRNGDLTDCRPKPMGNGSDCIQAYDGKNLGIGMVIGGAVVAGLGTYLMLFTRTETSVAVGPGGVSVAGKF